MTDQLWTFFAVGLAVLLLSLGMWRRGKAGKEGSDTGGDGGVSWIGGDGGSSSDCGGGDGGGGCGGGD